MHFKREINYHDYEHYNILSAQKKIYHVPLQYFRTNSLHNRGKMCQPCHPAGSIMVNQI